MNRLEHIIATMEEECLEVAKEASKALRFGLGDCAPGTDVSNFERMKTEMEDLTAMWRLLCSQTGRDPELSIINIQAKIEKFHKFLRYSKEQGTLTGE